MADPEPTQPLVIGLTGSFGSGCEYVAKNILEPLGYRSKALSSVLRREYNSRPPDEQKEYKDEAKKQVRTSPRRELQLFGDALRREKKDASYLAKQAITELDQEQKENPNGKWVVRGIRNPGEIHAFRERYHDCFFLFGIYASRNVRWEREKSVYDRDEKSFDEDDLNDTGEGNEDWGQRVGDCFYESDVVFSNDRQITAIGNEDFKALMAKVTQYVDLVREPLTKRQPIRPDEALMAMAYAASQRSSCVKRKVGALIVREAAVISSGFNEVPGQQRPCYGEFKQCLRDQLSGELLGDLIREEPVLEKKKETIKRLLKKHARMLDYCRALHAEESALLNLVRSGAGAPLDTCTMYTTTFPCRLCANKIVSVGLKRLVYFEPYPDPESRAILDGGGVKAEFFEGVTFRAYFRIYGEQR